MKTMKKTNLKRNAVYLGSALCLLSACAMPSLSPQQCLNGNWQAIGYNDGVAGHYPSRINDHQQACAETGVVPDFQAWQRGRQQGLAHYCTEANARRRGEQGQSFNAVCPASQASRLQSIHDRAYRRYQRQQQLSNDKRKVERLREELSKLRSGDMLDFESESEAREYMLRIQKEILVLEKRIRKNEIGEY